MAKNILKSIIIFIICVILGNMLYGMYKEMSLSERPQSINSIQNNLYNSEKINQKVEYESILEEYKGIQVPVHKTPIHPVKSPETESYRPDGLSEEALAFFQALSSEPRHITEICAQTSLSIAKALSAATELELCGFIQSFSGRRYAKI